MRGRIRSRIHQTKRSLGQARYDIRLLISRAIRHGPPQAYSSNITVLDPVESRHSPVVLEAHDKSAAAAANRLRIFIPDSYLLDVQGQTPS